MEKLLNSSSRTAIDVGILVQDMEQSLGFYCDYLSLTVKTTVATSLIGKGQMIQLEHGSSLVKLIELEQPPNRQSPKGLSAASGYRYITLLVSDITTRVKVLEQAEVEFFLPLTKLANGTFITMVYDPDGNLVELVQEPA